MRRRQFSAIIAGLAGAALVTTGFVPGVGASAPTAASTVAAPLVRDEGAAAGVDFTRFVDPFVSTEDDYGQDIPGAYAPNGLAKVNPMTTPGRAHSGYDYAEDQIAGFTSTNIDGVGGSGAGGDLLVVPGYVKYTTRPDTKSYAKTFSHDDEDAEPGFYRVALKTTQGTNGSISDTPNSAPIEAQMTADVRSSLQKYTFPNAGAASLVLDLRNNFSSRSDAGLTTKILADGRASFEGFVAGGFNGNSYRLFYYAETTTAVKGVRTWGGDGALSTGTDRKGADIGAIIDFDVAKGGAIELKTTISPISADQAKIDLVNELTGRDFAAVRADTKADWNDILGTVDVDSSVTSDPDGSLKRLFYTHLYRMFGSPANATSTTGQYRGVDGVVYPADGYTHYDSWGLWDDFRKQSILAIAYPEIYSDVTQSLVDLFASYANTSAGSLNSLEQSVPTVRFERASVVIADAISKGVTLSGLDLAYAGLKRHVGGGYNNAENSARGYLADDMGNTLGDSYDDWSMSIIADALGKSDEATFYLNRATNYTNLFNKDAWTNPAGDKVGVIYPKDAKGNWWKNVNLEQFEAAKLYQGTPWQYNWYAANDMGGMIQLMGGTKNAFSALSFMFGEQAPDDGSRMLHSNANEIDLQAPYLFNYVGEPSHTQYWARSIYTKATWNRYIATGSTRYAPSSGGEFRPPIKDKVFELDSDGFLPTMDNDTGMMSSTFVAAGLGLFPVTAGSDEYQIGSPFFENVTIGQPGGRSFAITANGVSPDDFYIQSASLNGASLDRTWLSYDEIQAGGNVTFDMGDAASGWAADGAQGYSMSDHVSSATYDKTGTNPVSRSTSIFAESDANDGTVGTTITLTVAGGSFAGPDGADLAATGAISATKVPEGLALQAIKRSATTVELTLAGTSRIHLPTDDVEGLTVSLSAAAFTGSIPRAAQSFDVKVTYAGYSFEPADTALKADEAGVVNTQIAVSLQGGATLSGAVGDDLIATGKATLVGLPAGLSATLVRQNASALALSVTGTLQSIAPSSFYLVLADSAFAGGVRARQVTGLGLTALAPFSITVGADWRAKLADAYEEAHLVKQGNYSPASFAVVAAAVAKAKALLDDPSASDIALQQALYSVNSAVDGLVLGLGGYRKLEGEQSNSWSGGDLKNEGINLGGVRSGSWIGYTGMDFSEGLPTGIDIRYVTNSNRSPEDSAVEIHVDAPDGPLITTVALPRSGSDWNAYTTVSAVFGDSAALGGSTSVYFVFRGTTTSALPFVANLDSFQFTKGSTDPEAPIAFTKLLATDATELHPGIDKSAGRFENLNNNEWALFRGYDFGAAGADSIQINYDKPSTRTPENTAVEVRLGSLDAPASAVVPLSSTGTGWGTYNTISTAIDPAIFIGVHDVYFVFTAPAADGAHPYVANVAWMLFGSTPEDTPTSYRLEAESFAANSGGSLGVENSTGPDGVRYTNIKGTLNDDWLRYDGVDFGDNTATSVTVRYVNNSARCGLNSRIDVFLDSRDGAPFTTVPLPVTGSAWSAVGTTTVDLPTGITGAHTVFFVLHTDGDATHRFVANIDWVDFGYGVNVKPLIEAIALYTPLIEHADRYLGIDFRTFSRAFDSAKSVATTKNVSAEAVAEALRTLKLSASQLEWKVIRQLDELIGTADALTGDGYTPESFAAVVVALERARAVGDDTSYSAYQAAFAALREAVNGLVVVVPDTEAPVVTLPTQNSIEFGTAFDPLLGVSARDAIDGDVTASITVTGSVNVSSAGSYPLSYRATDAAGNVGTATRTMVVLPQDVAEEPGSETPKPNVPGGSEPGAGQPGAGQPGAGQPGGDRPAAGQSGAAQGDPSTGVGDLARTGIQIGGWLALAVLLLLLGTGVVILRRRTKGTVR